MQAGNLWSTIWSTLTAWHGGASAMPPYRGIVYAPDLRLGAANCQLDGFVIAGGSELLSIHERSFLSFLLDKEK